MIKTDKIGERQISREAECLQAAKIGVYLLIINLQTGSKKFVAAACSLLYDYGTKNVSQTNLPRGSTTLLQDSSSLRCFLFS